ncbi:mitogen-activated protein kinase kinase kinase 3-like [Paramacrobiotus metropolitanus]|uniref:mitogen-activated protein kinase kinase kinase 3-like n=1 Tax=Paramacrobiotus metropolitanus TaxID=2943436 RepID=UPI002445F93B|nr:mitogen-activated protein kinase kinase kinase 3-like [Paramacrobiotus metropolitanus]
MTKLLPIQGERYGQNWNYEGLHLIAKGAFGQIYKAKLIEPGNSLNADFIALKVVHFKNEEVLSDESAREKMRKRFQRLLEIKHHCLVVYHQITIDSTTSPTSFTVHLLMENCSGGDLAGRLQKVKATRTNARSNLPARITLDLRTAVCYAQQIAEGLQCLHRNCIIHGDLKPGNVLIRVVRDEAGIQEQLVIGDLDDFIQMQNNTTCSKDVSTTHTCGTLRYMSPEMHWKMSQTPTVSPGRKVDIWSLGCIMLEMVNCILGIDQLWLRNVKSSADKKRGDNVEDYSYALLVCAGYVPIVPKETPAAFADCICRCLSFPSEQRPRAAEVMEMLHDPDVLHKMQSATSDSCKCSLV